MAIIQSTITVNQALFQPLDGLATLSPHARFCPSFSDEEFVRLGVQRVIEMSESGRGFLQEHGARFDNTPNYANYFATLRSQRRCDVLTGVNLELISSLDGKLHDRIQGISELANYECFAADGHWHKAAAHDERHEGMKMAVGHFYSVNLRTHTLRHLAAGEGLHEHDMSVLKRIKPKGLRHDVPKGRRVIIIYDKAGIDFGFWKRCRKECAVYFISRVKENMVFEWIENRSWDVTDSCNHGVSDDHLVMTREGIRMRIVYYTDPLTGVSYQFLTNEMDLSPGVIVELYRLRWDSEKVFDEVKNKLNEKKAWATSLVAKTAQAQFVAITHNLLLKYEYDLEIKHGVVNHAENQRREKRIREAVEKCEDSGHLISGLVTRAQRATQRSVKFVRWIRQSIQDEAAEAVALLRLRGLYATL